MKCGTRSLAVLGALALSAMGLVPAAWAADVGQADPDQTQSGAVQPTHAAEPSGPASSAQSGEERPGLVDTPIPDIQAVAAAADTTNSTLTTQDAEPSPPR